MYIKQKGTFKNVPFSQSMLKSLLGWFVEIYISQRNIFIGNMKDWITGLVDWRLDFWRIFYFEIYIDYFMPEIPIFSDIWFFVISTAVNWMYSY